MDKEGNKKNDGDPLAKVIIQPADLARSASRRNQVGEDEEPIRETNIKNA